MVIPVQVGDRPFTDIVYGNRNGFLTILTEPLSLVEEPFIVKQVDLLHFYFPFCCMLPNFFYWDYVGSILLYIKK